MLSKFARSARVSLPASLAILLGWSHAAAQSVPGAPFLQGGVVGQTAVLSWTAVVGASSYEVGVGLQPGSYLTVQNVGALTTVTVPAPAGVFYVRVRGRSAQGAGAPSNEIGLTVTNASTAAAPAAPRALQASVSGRTVVLSWQLGAGAGPATSLVFGVGSSSGAINLGAIPLQLGTQTTTSVPPGVYFARLYAVGPGGASPASNEVVVNVSDTLCASGGAPTLSTRVTGTQVTLSWSAVAGAAGYRIDVSSSPSGPLLLSQPFGAGTTGFTQGGVPAGVYYARATAITACGTQATGPEAQIQVNNSTPGSRPRTPDPGPGRILPLPNRLVVVEEVARRFPADLRASCRDSGGNNTWLFRLVDRLRQEDSRWGLNWKRAVIGDMSQDVITYHYGAGADEGSYEVYVIDVIAGHCGSNPQPWWNNVTVLGSRGARFTLTPYVQAGFQP